MVGSFRSLLDARTAIKGKNKYDRALKDKQRSFDRWFESTLTKHDVTIDGVKLQAVVQDQNQANNKGLSDDKYLITKLGTRTDVGSIVDWHEKLWLVFSNEYKTIQTHNQQIIKICNHDIKWVMENGEVSGNGKGCPAHVQNNTLYTLGVAMNGGNAWAVNAKMAMFLPMNKETYGIRIGQRLFIGDNVYEVMMRDLVSRSGLIYYLLEENFYNKETDDFENRVADAFLKRDSEGHHSGKENNEGNDKVDTENNTLTLNGSNTVKIGKSITITASLSNDKGEEKANPVKEWIVSDIDSVSTIVEKDSGKIILNILKNFKYVGKKVTITAKSDDGTLASKTINIISPY